MEDRPAASWMESPLSNSNEKRNEALADQNRELLRALNAKTDVSSDRWHSIASQHCDIAEEAKDPDLLFRSCKLLAEIDKANSSGFSVNAAEEFYRATLAVVARHTTPEQYAKILAELEGEGGA